MSNQAINRAIDCDLRGSVKSVLIVLANRANKDGECFPSLSTIARDAGIARSTAQEAIKKLEGLGLIKKRQRKSSRNDGWRSTLYRLSVAPIPKAGTPYTEDRPTPIPAAGNEPKTRTEMEPPSNRGDQVKQIGGRKGIPKRL